MPGAGRIPTFPTTASRRCYMSSVKFADSISATLRITFEERREYPAIGTTLLIMSVFTDKRYIYTVYG